MTTKKRIKDDLAGTRVGLFAIDGGTTTGLCYAPRGVVIRGTPAEMFRRHKFIVDEVSCFDRYAAHESMNELLGVKEIATLYLDCRAEWLLRGIPATRHYIVFEDFVLRGRLGSTDRTGISPARINFGLMCMLIKYPAVWVPQTPAMAKSRWSDDRLKSSNLWTKGKVHGRDATRHAALWLTGQG